MHGKTGMIEKPVLYPKDSLFYTGDYKSQAIHAKLVSRERSLQIKPRSTFKGFVNAIGPKNDGGA